MSPSETPLVENYDPNTIYGKQHVELILQVCDYRAVHVMEVKGGSFTGFDILEFAVDRLFDQLTKDLPEDGTASIILTGPTGKTLLCEDDECLEEDWLKDMVVSARIVDYDPPIADVVQEQDDGNAIPEGDTRSRCQEMIGDAVLTPIEAIERQERAGMNGDLLIWTITANTSDYPGKIIARPHSTKFDQPLTEVIVAETLDELRKMLPPGLSLLHRADEDDPVIVECWL